MFDFDLNENKFELMVTFQQTKMSPATAGFSHARNFYTRFNISLEKKKSLGLKLTIHNISTALDTCNYPNWVIPNRECALRNGATNKRFANIKSSSIQLSIN